MCLPCTLQALLRENKPWTGTLGFILSSEINWPMP